MSLTRNDLVKCNPYQMPQGWIKAWRIRKSNPLRTDPLYIDPKSGYAFFSLMDGFRYMETGDIRSCRVRPRRTNEIQSCTFEDRQGMHRNRKKELNPRIPVQAPNQSHTLRKLTDRSKFSGSFVDASLKTTNQLETNSTYIIDLPSIDPASITDYMYPSTVQDQKSHEPSEIDSIISKNINLIQPAELVNLTSELHNAEQLYPVNNFERQSTYPVNITDRKHQFMLSDQKTREQSETIENSPVSVKHDKHLSSVSGNKSHISSKIASEALENVKLDDKDLPQPTKKRGRPRLNKDKLVPEVRQELCNEPSQTKRRRGRPPGSKNIKQKLNGKDEIQIKKHRVQHLQESKKDKPIDAMPIQEYHPFEGFCGAKLAPNHSLISNAVSVNTESSMQVKNLHVSDMKQPVHEQSVRLNNALPTPFTLPFGDFWLDPCIEFSVKTDIVVPENNAVIQDYSQHHLSSTTRSRWNHQPSVSEEMSHSSIQDELVQSKTVHDDYIWSLRDKQWKTRLFGK